VLINEKLGIGSDVVTYELSTMNLKTP
jgi:hypothetical protein